MKRFGLVIFTLFFALSSHAAESPFARTTNVTAQRLYTGPQESFILSLPSGLVMRPFEVDALVATAFQGSALIVTTTDNRFKRSLMGAQLRTDISVSVGLPNDLEVGIRLPFILSQQSEYIGFGLESPPDPSILGDTQLLGQWQDLQQGSSWVNLAHTLTLTVPTGDSQTYNSRDSIAAELRSTVSRWFGPVLGAISAGYHYQEARQLPDQVDGSRIRFGIGTEYLHQTQQTDHRFSFELDGYLPTSDDSPTQSGLSAGIGYALAMYENWQLGTQLHSALTDAFGLPAHQTIVTLGYRHITNRRPPRCVNEDSYLHDDRCDPPDSDRDGVFDPDDRCPTVPEDRDGFEDEDGCPDPDNDQDKILDEADKCPNAPEDFDKFEDEDGCPDPDNDEDDIPDETDKCPLEPETKNGFDDEDGCPEPDDDNDGIPNANDRCPSEAEDIDGFEDKDGCPDPDNDQDGILDPKDLCPNEPEDKNGIRDDDGCPDEILAVKTTEEIIITDKILFIHGQVIPRKISRPILVAVKDILVAHPRLYVQIEGHTDDYGGTDFNRYLSQARAQAVLDGIVRLSGQGQVLRARLTAVGFGKDKPAATNSTKEGRAKNRRVIFRIMSQ